MRIFAMLSAAVAGAILVLSALPASAADEARVRVVHASPDAPNVDVYANGNRVLTNVPFGAISDYLAVPAGTYRLQVTPAGSPAGGAVIDINATLGANRDYTVVALDRVSQIKSRILEDQNAAPAPGNAHVQVIHASPNAPAVDIASRGGAVLVPNLPFGQKAGPLPVPAGNYDLEVRAAGTSTVALPVNGVSLAAGKVYTFIAMGLLGEAPALRVVPAAVDGVGASAPAPTPAMRPPSAGDAGLLDDSRPTFLLPLALIAAVSLAAAATIRARVRA